ncbi:Hsp20/alpha crystallin family protein [Pelagicoccus sp. SDUM812005]|uniref:Hsp20/alpha crystallin family protein n=1 Tax=Pelagicoccus sp. SDUM812005 TaxID=3041257 RepID=UPI0028103E09|nr:Hsp20/alpha crystallin family protein [Pelagicoccus sp. SDUM812005]MDQ8182307.1 Hsp20/alpha crystallin family protein [Pelagicoccus sp. SDUM812005]
MTLLNITKTQQPECSTASRDATSGEKRRFARPQYRVRELDTQYTAEVDLPGVPKDGVELSVADGVLEISAARGWKDRADWSPLAGVAEDGLTYRLNLELGDAVDAGKISAELQDGVLKLTFGKAEEKKPRRIAIA